MDTDYKSRTRKKNEDRALQRLGEQLVTLPFGQLETMGLPEMRNFNPVPRKVL